MQTQKRIGNYIFEKQIGSGSFATVFKGHHQSTKQEVAIKMIARNSPNIAYELIDKEVRILYKLQHPHIVRLLDFQRTQNNYYLIFEFCRHGDLQSFIKDNFPDKRMPEFEAQKICQQIFSGIKAMKDQCIVHRDLKLANLLVAQDFVVKIADFGFARFVEGPNLLLESFLGTPLTMAPEILERKPYDDKCDIWSLGVIIYQILTGRFPFEPKIPTLEELKKVISSTSTVQFPKDITISDCAKELINSMLTLDTSKRISFQALFEHPWVTGAFEPKAPNTQLPSDLDASAFLKSAYDQKRILNAHKSRSELRKNSGGGAIISKEQEAQQNRPSMPELNRNDSKVEEIRTRPEVQEKPQEKHQMNEFERENRKWNELFGAVTLAKTYMLLKQRCNDILQKFEAFEAIYATLEETSNPKILQIALLSRILGVIKDYLTAKVILKSEKTGNLLLSIDIAKLSNIIMSNSLIFKNLLPNREELVDLHSVLRSKYCQYFEMIKREKEGISVEKYRDYTCEQLLQNLMLALSESTALDEFVSEKSKKPQSLENYKTCLFICDIIMIQNQHTFTLGLAKNEKAETASDPLKDMMDKFEEYYDGKLVFEFEYLPKLLAIAENVKAVTPLLDVYSFESSSSPDESRVRYIEKMNDLRSLINMRIEELSAEVLG